MSDVHLCASFYFRSAFHLPENACGIVYIDVTTFVDLVDCLVHIEFEDIVKEGGRSDRGLF